MAVKQDKVSVCKNALNFTAGVGMIFGNPFANDGLFIFFQFLIFDRHELCLVCADT
jgi:hypothetical protein